MMLTSTPLVDHPPTPSRLRLPRRIIRAWLWAGCLGCGLLGLGSVSEARDDALDIARENLEKSSDLHVKTEAAQRIGTIGDDRGAAALVEALQAIEDPRESWHLRKACEISLIRLSSKRTRTVVSKVLRDPRPWVRTTAVVVLAASEDEDLIEILRRRLEEDPDPEVRSTCVALLWREGSDSASAILRQVAQTDEEAAVRARAAHALARMEIGSAPEH